MKEAQDILRLAKSLVAKGRLFSDYGDDLKQLSKDYKRELEGLLDGISGDYWDADIYSYKRHDGSQMFEVSGTVPDWGMEQSKADLEMEIERERDSGPKIEVSFSLGRKGGIHVKVNIFEMDGMTGIYRSEKEFPMNAPVSKVLKWANKELKSGL